MIELWTQMNSNSQTSAPQTSNVNLKLQILSRYSWLEKYDESVTGNIRFDRRQQELQRQIQLG